MEEKTQNFILSATGITGTQKYTISDESKTERIRTEVKEISCPKCGSKARDIGMSMTTCMAWSPGYYDEEGKFVSNMDPNITTNSWTCRSCGNNYSSENQRGKTYMYLEKN